MNKEERLPVKSLYKLTLWSLKVIPMVLAFCALLNTVLSFYGINCDILSHLGGISLFPLLFLYLSSAVFRFCIYHRMFLHYLLVTDVLNMTDFYIGIPLNNRTLFGLYLVITGIFLFLILYFYRRKNAANDKKTAA